MLGRWVAGFLGAATVFQCRSRRWGGRAAGSGEGLRGERDGEGAGRTPDWHADMAVQARGRGRERGDGEGGSESEEAKERSTQVHGCAEA